MYANAGLLGTPEGADAVAGAAERCGLESVWTIEHVVLPAGFRSPYPYSRSGRMPGGEDAPMVDPLIWLTWVAARTESVRLATGVVILPQRNPLVLAKQVATLDVLSRGRTILGVGVGWLREEFAALGVPFEGRGRRADEYIGALRALWTEAEPTYRGETVAFERAKCYPKPPQGSVPVVIGGHTPAAARRAGRLGDGFFPARPDRLPELLPVLRGAAAGAGRDPDAVEITTGGPPTGAYVRMLEDQGVTRLLLQPPVYTPDGIGPALEALLDDAGLDPAGTRM